MCTRTLARESWPFPLVVIGLPELNRPVMRCEPAVLEDCFGRAISAKPLDPKAFAPRTCGSAQSDVSAADMRGMADSDELRGGPTVRPTSTELRHVNVPFSHLTDLYPQ